MTESPTLGPDQPRLPSTSYTRPITDLGSDDVREKFFGAAPPGQQAIAALPPTTSSAEPLAANSTTAGSEKVEPSMNDAIGAPFIDVRTLGVETWPLGGIRSWQGTIVEVDRDIFTAELISLDSDAETSKLRADFRMDALDTDDRVPVAGDLFYLIAQQVRIRDRLRTVYSLQLRRSGSWTKADVEDIRARVRQRLTTLSENVE